MTLGSLIVGEVADREEESGDSGSSAFFVLVEYLDFVLGGSFLDGFSSDIFESLLKGLT
jgi:hypothetical protein